MHWLLEMAVHIRLAMWQYAGVAQHYGSCSVTLIPTQVFMWCTTAGHYSSQRHTGVIVLGPDLLDR